MALKIKSPEVEKLVAAIAEMTGESKTEAVLRALEERRERLSLQHPGRERGRDFLRYLEEEVWPKAPPGQLGRRLSREEEDDILGYGSGACDSRQLGHRRGPQCEEGRHPRSTLRADP